MAERPRKMFRDASVPPPAAAQAVPEGATSWPLYIISAAMIVQTNEGDVGTRVLQGYKLAPDALTARDWFLMEIQKGLPRATVVDLAVTPIDVNALSLARMIGQTGQQALPQ